MRTQSTQISLKEELGVDSAPFFFYEQPIIRVNDFSPTTASPYLSAWLAMLSYVCEFLQEHRILLTFLFNYVCVLNYVPDWSLWYNM